MAVKMSKVGLPSGMIGRRKACMLGSIAVGSIAASLMACGGTPSEEANAKSTSTSGIDAIIESMTLDQKIAQLIMPAIRSWDGEDSDVTDLDKVPALAQVLRRHQYCGVILFGSNVVDVEQTVKLVSNLQKNNAEGSKGRDTATIPYLVAVDQEGGSVARLSMGTRGTGSMAIGATGVNAHQNARDTGTIFGLELSALGINVNLAPCADVIDNPADQGLSTRVFSNDPKTVGDLAQGFADGVAKSRVITCFKHFPGVGDGSDDPTSELITLEELRASGLAQFSTLIEYGANMIMTSAVTFPSFDDRQTLADGVAQGYYPATMSLKIVGELLRKELGFDGVVITDALDMEQFVTEPDTGKQLLLGDPHSVEQGVAIAQKCIEAGCDILLLPKDLKNPAAAQWYLDYIAGIVALVDEGKISVDRIDESVHRILSLKETFGVFDTSVGGENVDADIALARQSVGSHEHHQVEREIAGAAVTLLKGSSVVPVPGEAKRVVILGRTDADQTPIHYALEELMTTGDIDPEACVEDHLANKTTGEKTASKHIYLDYYYDKDKGLVWHDGLSSAIAKADYVLCMSAIGAGMDALQESDACIQGITRALNEAHAAKAKFVIVSNNLPIEGSRFPEADAVVCSYLSAGYAVKPDAGEDADHMGAINANVPAALRAVFGAAPMPGTLPIDVYELKEDTKKGTWSYTDKILFARGTSAS